jgi:hypothetical protein
VNTFSSSLISILLLFGKPLPYHPMTVQAHREFRRPAVHSAIPGFGLVSGGRWLNSSDGANGLFAFLA